MDSIKINRTFLIILLGILAAIGPFTIDMYLPGFRDIAADLGTTEKHVAFTLTSYFIGIALGQLFYGPIIDKYGRKKPLLFGLLLYVAASLGIALSPNIESMIFIRFFQALGGCVGMVATTAIITDVYEINARARAFSLIMLVMGVAPVIAPSAGSFFLGLGGWTYIFYFLAFFAVFVFGLIYFFLPETNRYMHTNQLKSRVIIQDYFSILKNKTFFYYTLAGSISNSILFAYLSSASFVFLTFYGLSKTTFSMLFAINALSLIIGSYLNGMLTKKVNYIKIARYAAPTLILFSFTALLVVLLQPTLPYYWVVAGLVCVLFSIGFIYPNTTAASLVPFTNNAGAASALGGSVRMAVAAVVAAFIGAFQGENATTMFLIISILAVLGTVFLYLSPPLQEQRELEEDVIAMKQEPEYQ